MAEETATTQTTPLSYATVREMALTEGALREHYWIALKRVESVVGNVSLTHDQKVGDIFKIVRTALYNYGGGET